MCRPRSYTRLHNAFIRSERRSALGSRITFGSFLCSSPSPYSFIGRNSYLSCLSRAQRLDISEPAALLRLDFFAHPAVTFILGVARLFVIDHASTTFLYMPSCPQGFMRSERRSAPGLVYYVPKILCSDTSPDSVVGHNSCRSRPSPAQRLDNSSLLHSLGSTSSHTSTSRSARPSLEAAALAEWQMSRAATVIVLVPPSTSEAPRRSHAHGPAYLPVYLDPT
jgi:hypothetical protein